jgi:hypothetical protein
MPDAETDLGYQVHSTRIEQFRLSDWVANGGESFWMCLRQGYLSVVDGAYPTTDKIRGQPLFLQQVPEFLRLFGQTHTKCDADAMKALPLRIDHQFLDPISQSAVWREGGRIGRHHLGMQRTSRVRPLVSRDVRMGARRAGGRHAIEFSAQTG